MSKHRRHRSSRSPVPGRKQRRYRYVKKPYALKPGDVPTFRLDGTLEIRRADGTLTTVRGDSVENQIPMEGGGMMASGNVMMAGEGLPFHAVTFQCDPETVDHPFASCVNDKLRLCCGFETLTAEGEIDESTIDDCSFSPTPCDTDIETLGLVDSDITCTTTSQSVSTLIGYDLTQGYFSGPFPISPYQNFNGQVGTTLLVWCDSGTVRAVVLDGNNCPFADPEAVANVIWDADTLEGTIEINSPESLCCQNGMESQDYRIHIRSGTTLS